MYQSALKYLTDQLGEPTRGHARKSGRADWELRGAGALPGVVSVELEAENDGKAARLTIADPSAEPPHRIETFTMTTPAQFGAALAAVLDHIA